MPKQDILKQNLYNAALFKDVATSAVRELVDGAAWRIVEQGDYVYRQGEHHRRFYIVADGEVELTVDAQGGGQLIVGHIGPGGHFGETSLLTESSNCLNARALTELHLLGFTADAFSSVLLANEAVARNLSAALAKRLRVSFHDHANSLVRMKQRGRSTEHNLDSTFF